jgi:hypothetical protein
VPLVTMLFDYLFTWFVVVTGVEAKMLWLFLGRFRTIDDDRFNSLLACSHYDDII